MPGEDLSIARRDEETFSVFTIVMYARHEIIRINVEIPSTTSTIIRGILEHDLHPAVIYHLQTQKNNNYPNKINFTSRDARAGLGGSISTSFPHFISLGENTPTIAEGTFASSSRNNDADRVKTHG